MGELLGLPEWLAKTIFVGSAVLVFFGFVWRNTNRQIAALRMRRPNPTREEFVQALAADVRPETAEFLWETIALYIAPDLTPHPDDDLFKDLPIDEDDIGMDWPREYAERRGFHHSNLPDWPTDWPVSVRNYARWLEMGPA